MLLEYKYFIYKPSPAQPSPRSPGFPSPSHQSLSLTESRSLSTFTLLTSFTMARNARLMNWVYALVAAACMILYGYDASVYNAVQGSKNWVAWANKPVCFTFVVSSISIPELRKTKFGASGKCHHPEKNNNIMLSRFMLHAHAEPMLMISRTQRRSVQSTPRIRSVPSCLDSSLVAPLLTASAVASAWVSAASS